MKPSIWNPPSPMKRRTFIGFGLAAAASYAARVRAQSPNSKLQIGIIGAGGRGQANTGGVTGAGAVIHTLCDVNPQALDGAKGKYPQARAVTDWRKVVEDPAVDAVVVSTADHHHALASLAAMRAGKHVYCEKPLAHTVQEARWMQDEYKKRRGKIATQMGTQIHATENYRRAVEAIQDGSVGQVKQAHVWCGRTIQPVPVDRLDPEPVPEGFDWDVWLGPAPLRPHNRGYWLGGNLNWNRRWEFGNGVLGDMGSHLIDLPFWALGLGDPVSVKAEGTPADKVAAPPSQIITWHHPEKDNVFGCDNAPARAAVDVIWYHGPEGMKTMAERLQPLLGDATDIASWHIGVAFVGEHGTLVADYGRIVRRPADSSQGLWCLARKIPSSPGHYEEWIRACRGEGESLCHFDYSGKLIEHNLLGNVAHRAARGETLRWDPQALKFPDHEEATALLGKKYREGWAPG